MGKTDNVAANMGRETGDVLETQSVGKISRITQHGASSSDEGSVEECGSPEQHPSFVVDGVTQQ